MNPTDPRGIKENDAAADKLFDVFAAKERATRLKSGYVEESKRRKLQHITEKRDNYIQVEREREQKFYLRQGRGALARSQEQWLRLWNNANATQRDLIRTLQEELKIIENSKAEKQGESKEWEAVRLEILGR